MTHTEAQARIRKFTRIILAYPFALIVISIAINLLAFGRGPLVPALPSDAVMTALVLAAVLLVANHIWLMTSTELTRLRHGLFATPEEWAASGRKPSEADANGLAELERRHNAHRNSTENTVLFGFLALVFSLTSPTAVSAYLWITGFALARLGYTASYLGGSDSFRGIFMSAGLLALFGLVSALVLGLLA